MEAKSRKRFAKLELERFKEDDLLEEVFRKVVDLYGQVFDDLEELKPMLGPAYEIEMKNVPI